MPRYVGIIDFSDDEFKDDESAHYCKYCETYGFQVRLGPRIYPNKEQVPEDERSKWRQCIDCGTIVAIHELEKRAIIKDVVSTVENPFELGSDFLGVDSRKTRKKKRNDKDLDWIQDEDLKRELKKGSTLLSYSEQMP